MKFLLDENVKRRLAKSLVEAGHDVKFTKKGEKNSTLFLSAKKGGRILVTSDKDFLNTALYPPKESKGVIVFRVFPPTFENMKKSFFGLLSQFREKEFSGKTISLFKEGFEVFIK